MYLGWLLLLTVVLAWPAPRLLPRWTALRGVPGPALWLWQGVSLGAVVAGLELAPLAVLYVVRVGDGLPAPRDHIVLAAIAALVSALLAGRLLARAHVVGRRLRKVRREHRELVDLLDEPVHAAGLPAQVRVLSHPTATAYCVPGLSRRVVLTSGTIEALPPAELRAVLAHELAHLRHRHDLVLEFFTVWHTAVPRRLRSDRGLETVRLLIELLADRSAERAVGRVPVARALVALARAEHPTGTLGHEDFARIRLEQLTVERRHPALATCAGLLGMAAVLAPLALAALMLLNI
ncbi:M56 family metallopeptidase [Allobranchiibius sp. CTAmp26]|uniref:M56 family metallopeptidase n=1 Tax=Allobranchiibius sp. CTAmp26 TaxID=2815214 RepID=UPI001AA1115D|nr:M56 family metallopeptidase [Allobranchiibius sp. CTAmp26]MBO1754846.1 M56 family metallopeptidase [Allobranchiibius sp. CTAmp26]